MYSPRPAGPSRPDAHLSRLSLTSQTPTPSARRVARRSSTTSPPRRCVFHVGTGRTPPPATRRSGGQSPSPTVERSLGTAPKKGPSLTSRASPPRNPGCLRHHPHHPRSALDAEDDPGRLRRYVSSRARDRAAPEGDRGHSRFKPNGAEKSKHSFRFDFLFGRDVDFFSFSFHRPFCV